MNRGRRTNREIHFTTEARRHGGEKFREEKDFGHERASVVHSSAFPLRNAGVRTLLLFILLLPFLLTAADHLRIADCDAVVRPGLPFRCRIERDPGTESGKGPWTLMVALNQNGIPVVNLDFAIERLAQVRAGIDAVLLPPRGISDQAPLRLHVVLASASRDLIEQSERILPTPAFLWREAERAGRRALAVGDDVRPRLWLEQATELAHLNQSLFHLDRLASLTRRLDAWAAGERPVTTASGGLELAFADPVDSSVQPLRLHLPVGDVRAIAVLLGNHPAPVIKAEWNGPAAAWLAAASASGLAVVEVYPAGDRFWNGVGLRRAGCALAAARATWPPLARAPAALVGIGAGAGGAVALAEREPLLWHGLGLIAPRPFDDAETGDAAQLWSGLNRPGRWPGNLANLPIICSGPLPDRLEIWRGRLESAGGSLVANLAEPNIPAFWRSLADNAAVQPRPPQRWTVQDPGRYGDVTVQALTTWGVPGTLVATGQGWTAEGLVLGLGGTKGKIFGRATGPLAAYATGPFVVVVGTAEHAASVADNRELAARFIAAWRAHAHGTPPLIDDSAFRARDWPRHHLVLVGNPRSNRVLATLVDAENLPLLWDGRELRCGEIRLLRSLRAPVALCQPHPANDGRLLVILDGAPAWTGSGLPLAGAPDLVLGPPEQPLMRRLFSNDWR